MEKLMINLLGWRCRIWQRLVETKGQGTAEYAILVGVLVVVAIVAITLFRPQISQLWDNINNGMEQLMAG